jgi:hypothetical protein
MLRCEAYIGYAAAAAACSATQSLALRRAHPASYRANTGVALHAALTGEYVS